MLCGALFFWACATRLPAVSEQPARNLDTDYNSKLNWAALPDEPDASDEVPLPLQEDYRPDSSVDVFFVHPTTYTDAFEGHWNAPTGDLALNKKTDGSTIKFQASVFNEYRVFAPRYAQAHIQAFYTSDTAQAIAALNRAYADIKAAFEYYMLHWNSGRPIIIASHSQGTRHAKQLLREFFEGKPLQKQLVAAYLIGLPVEPDYFSQLPVCADSSQTGCFVTWRTFREGFEPDYDSSYRHSIVVNPLSWRADTTYAAASLHRGAVLRNFNKVFLNVSDAQVHDDLLWVSRPHFPGSKLYRAKNYHIGDINLFYLNIRYNLRARVSAFKAQR